MDTQGVLVRAVREGWWLLLDEVNLAPPEALERVAGLLEGARGSITLAERGDTRAVPRHPDFRLMAAMNPATGAPCGAASHAGAIISSYPISSSAGSWKPLQPYSSWTHILTGVPPEEQKCQISYQSGGDRHFSFEGVNFGFLDGTKVECVGLADAGKRELPAPLRNRFTEFWVAEPTAVEDLAVLVAAYLAPATRTPPTNAVVAFYQAAKAEAVRDCASVMPSSSACKARPAWLLGSMSTSPSANQSVYLLAQRRTSLGLQDTNLADGAGLKPSYNLRTLCRALDYARAALPVYGLQRAVYDGFAMSFLTQLQADSAARMDALLRHHFLPGTTTLKVGLL